MEVEMFLTGGEMLFWSRGGRRARCGCGLSAGAGRPLGGKGLGGGPDKTEKLSFHLNAQDPGACVALNLKKKIKTAAKC